MSLRPSSVSVALAQRSKTSASALLEGLFASDPNNRGECDTQCTTAYQTSPNIPTSWYFLSQLVPDEDSLFHAQKK